MSLKPKNRRLRATKPAETRHALLPKPLAQGGIGLGEGITLKVVERTLEQEREAQRALIRTQQRALEEAGVTVAKGRFDTLPRAQARLALTGILALAPAANAKGWTRTLTRADGTEVAMTSAEILELVRAVADHVDGIAALATRLLLRIDQAATPETVRAVTWPPSLMSKLPRAARPRRAKATTPPSKG